MKLFLLVFFSIFIIYVNYFVFCEDSSEYNFLKKEKDGLSNESSNDENLYSPDYNENDNVETIATEKNKEKSTTSTSTTTTTSIPKISHSTTTEVPKIKTTYSSTGYIYSSTTIENSSEKYSTPSPCPTCPSCSTNFALGTFFFGNFFGMALMLVMGYIYLSWLRRTSTIPQSARLY